MVPGSWHIKGIIKLVSQGQISGFGDGYCNRCTDRMKTCMRNEIFVGWSKTAEVGPTCSALVSSCVASAPASCCKTNTIFS